MGAEAAALAEPVTLKISSKRQLTIPAKAYREVGFSDYALCTWTAEGLLIQPLQVDDEADSAYILSQLVDAGYEGEQLIEAYEQARKDLRAFTADLEEAERDIAEGRTELFEEMATELRAKYDL